MDSRPNLQTFLENVLGSRNVYFNPPESIRMNYPAIVYSRKRIDNSRANNAVYKRSIAYEVTVIDEDCDSEIVDKMSLLPMCSYDRHFKLDNLNHDVFTLYY